MGFIMLNLKMPTDYNDALLRKKIKKKLRVGSFSYTIEKQGLDARNKHDIFWQLRVCVTSPQLKGAELGEKQTLIIPTKKRKERVIVVGSGPAGFFAAYVLQCAGFNVSLQEQGPEVEGRFKDIVHFERTGNFSRYSNYAFGEGGAGTFSDGKLTCRSKSISIEKDFIYNTYIEAGAPPEIAWLTHPHLGSDNLRKIVKHLRKMFTDKGGEIFFDTRVKDLRITNGGSLKQAVSVDTDKGTLDADYFIFAVGQASYETYRMLINRGVAFGSKPFAVGCRAEHPQRLINQAQWGCDLLPGIKAAEYRLTYKAETNLPVYSFCMCPGGKVVPAAAELGTNIVNGMSNYRRNAPFANAALVAGVNLDAVLGKENTDPLEALDWVEKLEQRFYQLTGSFSAPAITIKDFLAGTVSPVTCATSYPLGLAEADLSELLPPSVTASLKEGLTDFCKKIKGYDQGILLGLESKTSSPIQARRDGNGLCRDFANLYISGEGSGFAGGIISSAADGIKAAMDILRKNT